MISIVPVGSGGAAATGLQAAGEGGQFVIIVAARGLVACGIVDPAVSERFGFAVAIARGTPERPLVTPEDLLEARIAEVTPGAAKLGVAAGMTGREALERLS